MNVIQIRRIASIMYGVVGGLLWIIAPGPVALIFTIVGGLALGLMYALTGTQIREQGLGRNRNRRIG